MVSKTYYNKWGKEADSGRYALAYVWSQPEIGKTGWAIRMDGGGTMPINPNVESYEGQFALDVYEEVDQKTFDIYMEFLRTRNYAKFQTVIGRMRGL